MECFSVHGRENKEMALPPGFRFHPTDEELITHYLSPKTLQSNFCAIAIGEVDLNKVEPWDLPNGRTKMGEREHYFFCMRDRKYPTGSRTNRATDAGFWKATGKDKEIYRGAKIIGMKKTLVFYRGRAPKGEKTNWVMHEYRLEGEKSLTSSPKNEWVISRVFHKSSGGKKIHISNMERSRDCENVSHHSNLQPSMDHYSGYYDDQRQPTTIDHVNFLSHSNEKKPRDETVDCSIINPFSYTKSSYSDHIVPDQFTSLNETVQDQSMMRYLLQDHENLKTEFLTKREIEIETDHSLVSSGHETGQGSDDIHFSRGPVDLDCLWNF